jgi:flagellar biosynthesis anti-sigma factor FlgM
MESRREEKEMRIDPQNPANGSSGPSRLEDVQAGQVKSSQQTASTEPNDTVQLSSGQATFRQLVSQLDQVPDIRQEQVSALRSAIGSGQYNPSDGQVASAVADQSFGVSEPA